MAQLFRHGRKLGVLCATVTLALFLVFASVGTASADTGDPSPSASVSSTPVSVTPKVPTFTIKGCGGLDNLLTIPTSSGVDYFVNGLATAAGQYDIYEFGDNPTTLAVVARARSGYTLTGQTSWSFAARTPECVAPQITVHCGGFTVTNKASYSIDFSWAKAGTFKWDGNETLAPGGSMKISTKYAELDFISAPSDNGTQFSVGPLSVPQGCATSKPTPTSTGATTSPATHTSTTTGPVIITDGSATDSGANSTFLTGGLAAALGCAVGGFGLRRRLRR